MPELKRVIAAYGDRVVMEETLPAALAALFKESVPAAPLQVRAGASSSGPTDQRAREALGHYDRAIERLKVGDWGGFGTESRLRKSAQDDKWSFCPTAGTLCPTNQERQ